MDSSNRDAFPGEVGALERVAALEAGQLALHARIDVAMEMIEDLRQDQREARQEARQEQERTRLWLGEKVDAVVVETAKVANATAKVEAQAAATNGEVRGLKRFMAGAAGAITFGTPLVLWLLDRTNGS